MNTGTIQSPVETLEFLEYIQHGVGPLNAAYSVGWSPHKLRQMMRDPGFAELVAEAHERKIETVEQRAYELAERGNLAAIQLILYCQASDQGVASPTQRVAINQQSEIRVEVVAATKAAVLELMDSYGVEALQAGGPLDGEVIDADVIDDAD